MNILIVDDSVVFRSQIKGALSNCIEFNVIETAANGKIALAKMERKNFDLIILDLEMPEMNGIQTLQAMEKMKNQPPTIVFSSLNARGADVTMQALHHGAKDFVTKPANVNNFEEALDHIKEQLIPKALQFIKGSHLLKKKVANSSIAIDRDNTNLSLLQKAPNTNWRQINPHNFKPKACVIGSSTGGPMALKEIFLNLTPPIRFPIFVAQHMPPIFTKSLASGIQQMTGIVTKEAIHYEEREKDCIYIAPGNFHMTVKESDGRLFTALDKRDKRNSVRPAVDYLFESAAIAYGNHCLGIVLTGMGSDGMAGSKALKDANGCVIIQDEPTSTVWGMPGSVFRIGAYDHMASIYDCQKLLFKLAKGIL